jgi:hypothetical protein
MLEERHLLKQPDISYDLDADGIVGVRDYLLAKRFDKDEDGKLSPPEHRAAISALKNGYEEDFYWGVEKSGPNRGHRLVQVRGEKVNAEQFENVVQTYPAHPLTKEIPSNNTVTELLQKRQEQTRKSILENAEKWHAANPYKVKLSAKFGEFWRKHPLHQSIKQIKDENWRNARISAGLTEISKDINSINPNMKEPSMSYVQNPEYQTHNEYVRNLKNWNVSL